MSFLYLLFVGSRVTILAFFAATTQGGKVYIWIVLLGHCLLMSLFFRPQKDQLGSRDLQGIQKTVTDQNRGRDASSTAGSNVQDENSSSGGCCSCYCAVPKCVSHLLKRYVQTLQRPNLKGNFTWQKMNQLIDYNIWWQKGPAAAQLLQFLANVQFH